MKSSAPKNAEPTSLIETQDLACALERFAQERKWSRFHSPKNLVMALTGEVGELASLFQWLTEEQSLGAAQDPNLGPAIRQELADVLIYLVRLASVLGVDLDQATQEKLTLNAQKYPVEKARGSSKKYDQL